MTWSAFLRTELVRTLIFVQPDQGNFAMQAEKQKKKKKKKTSPNKKKPKRIKRIGFTLTLPLLQ
ncbi:hypothetical protein CDEST_11107 [Colletotrichum destructivum]|uniref:Uncharacterized protein n=1 Tax=Colletotrichum destructivum TaxID=34406 RepID=A0AAX4ISJ7_9PEZI|nr:hypothetical protein CDEST_11107 [Colletotrichum destructivum]